MTFVRRLRGSFVLATLHTDKSSRQETTMPKGTYHELEGLLLTNRYGQPALEVGDGGTWRLALDGSTDGLLGRRVQVSGRRAGFDLLDVEQIHLVGAPPASSRAWWRRLLS